MGMIQPLAGICAGLRILAPALRVNGLFIAGLCTIGIAEFF